ncbi:MAG: glycosyltransferase, partial [Chloroflexi bacterium]|nr:glycosyltransferase [Chloroflexota bacterium]
MTSLAELEEQINERERELAELSMKYALRERELAEIKASTGYALLLAGSRVGRKLVPQGGVRDRALWRLICGARRTAQMVQRRFATPAPDESSRPQAARAANVVSPPAIDFTGVPVLPVGRPATYDVIIFPIIDWSFRFQRPQQIATKLAAAGHRVFYVSTGFHGAGNSVHLRPLGQRITEVRLPGPESLLLYERALRPELCDRFVAALSELRGALSIHDAVCLVDLPFWTPVALELRERFSWRIVYDCMDHHAGFPHSTDQMLESESRLSRESDLVLVTSRQLLEEQRANGVAAIHVPNATDFEHFRFGTGAVPASMPVGNRPVVGYYGAISDWFDTELVAELARARPDWQFVLIGHTVGANVEKLKGLPNVHFPGEQRYAELPAYLHAFDVCIIPFKKTALTDATNPVKLFEYLSAGKRVVATELDELKHYSEYVTLASNLGEWLAGIEAALHDSDTGAKERRIAFARENSWAARVADVRRELDRLFPLASIIIVTYNNVEVTRLCLDSMYRRTAYPTFEVIVVDNCSTDGTRDYLADFSARHDNFHLLLRDENEGFARANNLGVQAARGEYIVFLNNDTVVPAGWLSRLLHYLRDLQ